MAEDNLTYPVWLDPENRFQFMFRTIGVPESFLIDADGQIIHQWKGAILFYNQFSTINNSRNKLPIF